MIRILLVDDHAVVRTGYRRLLGAEPGLQVVGEAARADEANALVLQTTPDVALVDLSLRGSSGIEAIRGMLARRPVLRVLVLSMHEDAGHITQALRSGAHGYLTKHCEPEEVIDGIRRIALGKRVFSPEVAQILAEQALDGEDAFAQLTPREFEVLRLHVQGQPASCIAGALQLSPKTILNNLTLIRQKLDVENDFKLLQLAARHGLMTLHPAEA
ncbi:response regulator [Polaromonas naphthalenivorans]|uniref:Two component transcriptional regulator, LuxR family n=1 Tax=Polaromonas naphthalenivorans (strain CJ2) TaxID=365044 RepID=A1VTB5_POLNA|nr:response regulator transcription factor [Polaromonas naphthalenivorans]ABM38893.1 two component transcriptional regulator, LuxR family [Polaromonas naphthalenivorans CJ2]